uniref:Uncharacterized protein n=1 Tax=Arundo donax TaxID=35708 RepID=A0A0A8YSP8_ARUDO
MHQTNPFQNLIWTEEFKHQLVVCLSSHRRLHAWL